jgi:hypothetical protein
MGKYKQTLLSIGITVLLCLPVVVTLFHPWISGTADGFAHKFRFAAFHRSISEGNLRPRWLGDVALGYGAPIFLFNYIVPYYIVESFYRMGFSINTASQIMQALSVITAGIAMYIFVQKIWGDWSGIVAATIYSYAPYHVFTLFSYEAWGELWSYLFIPLILYLLLLAFEKPTMIRSVFLILSWALFVMTHNISAYISAPVILCFGVILAQNNKQKIIYLCKIFLKTICISAFQWIPAIFLTDTIKIPVLFAIEIKQRMIYFKPILTQILTNFQVIKTGYVQYYEFTIGLPIICVLLAGVVIFTLMAVKKLTGNPQRKPYALLALFSFTICVITLFLADPHSNALYGFRPLQYVLYPYRWLFIATFSGSMLAGFVLKKISIPSISFLAIVFVSGYPFIHPDLDTFSFDNSFFFRPQMVNRAYPTKKSMGIAEFLPVKLGLQHIYMIQDNYLARSIPLPKKFEIPFQSGSVTSSKLKQEYMTAHIHTSQKTPLTINTAWYPNWVAKIDGKKTAVIADNVGRIQLEVPKGTHDIVLYFSYSLAEKVGIFVSMIGVALLFLIK